MPGARPTGRLPPAQRLRKQSEFRRVRADSKAVHSKNFVLLLHDRTQNEKGADGQLARLGIVASRKVGNAVERNRAKRIVREAFRATRHLWQPGVDVVVIVRGPLGKAKLDDVVDEWRKVEPLIRRRSREAARDRARTSQRNVNR